MTLGRSGSVVLAGRCRSKFCAPHATGAANSCTPSSSAPASLDHMILMVGRMRTLRECWPIGGAARRRITHRRLDQVNHAREQRSVLDAAAADDIDDAGRSQFVGEGVVDPVTRIALECA